MNLEPEFKLMDINLLDDVSYDEVDKIMERYENLRTVMESRLKRAYGADALQNPKAYEQYKEFLKEFPRKTKEDRRRLAILEQIRKDNLLQNRKQ